MKVKVVFGGRQPRNLHHLQKSTANVVVFCFLFFDFRFFFHVLRVFSWEGGCKSRRTETLKEDV